MCGFPSRLPPTIPQPRTRVDLKCALECCAAVLRHCSAPAPLHASRDSAALADAGAAVATLIPADMFDDAVLLSQEFMRAHRSARGASTSSLSPSRSRSGRARALFGADGADAADVTFVTILGAAVAVVSALSRFFYLHCGSGMGGMGAAAGLVHHPHESQLSGTLTRAGAKSLSASLKRRRDGRPGAGAATWAGRSHADVMLSHSQAVAFVQALNRWHGEAPAVMPDVLALGMQEWGRSVTAVAPEAAAARAAAGQLIEACLVCIGTLAAQVRSVALQWC